MKMDYSFCYRLRHGRREEDDFLASFKVATVRHTNQMSVNLSQLFVHNIAHLLIVKCITAWTLN